MTSFHEGSNEGQESLRNTERTTVELYTEHVRMLDQAGLDLDLDSDLIV